MPGAADGIAPWSDMTHDHEPDPAKDAAFSVLSAHLHPHGLRAVGGFHDDTIGAEIAPGWTSLVLIGADGHRMWPVYSSAPEATDGKNDPLDRWSRRVLDAVADDVGAEAVYPFGGPPYQPFLKWGQWGEGARPSPICMLVSPGRGLWTSYRGALLFRTRIDLPEPDLANPCLDCPAPCLSACPVDAFRGQAYDVAACLGHLRASATSDCASGCLARRVCPVGVSPPEAQLRYHMEAFVSSTRHRV